MTPLTLISSSDEDRVIWRLSRWEVSYLDRAMRSRVKVIVAEGLIQAMDLLGDQTEVMIAIGGTEVVTL